MIAPIPTPTKMYGNTFLNVEMTCSLAYCIRSVSYTHLDVYKRQVLGAAAGISAWLYMAGRAASLFNRAIVALLAAFIAVNIAL